MKNISNSKNIKKIVLIFVFISISLWPLFGDKKESKEIFVTPQNLVDNVAFWKKIYTEVSLQEGIIHDREFPMIIYRIISIGNRTGRARTNHIRHYINEIKQQLKNIRLNPSSQWTPKEKEIYTLFLKYASASEIKEAEKRIRFQQGQKERFKEGLERSGAYMKHILAVFMKHKIPPRIAYLPHVESSFNIHAYSRVGAAGMWQFMRHTGRLYLTINYRVDERFDPYKSTEAAAKLLKRNYEKLNSWPLAITAYNHGLTSISRAVKVTKSRDLGVIIDKYKNRRFKFASKNFYGCFMAASEIAANPTVYFPDLKLHPTEQFHEIKLKKYYTPSTLAKHLGISQEQIKQLNPSLRSIVFRRQLNIPKGFLLKVPTPLTMASAQHKLETVPDNDQRNENGNGHYYSVEKGDTLYSISRAFKVSTDQLIIANEISSENRIYIGQVLRIPGKKQKQKIETTTSAPTPSAPPASTLTETSTEPSSKIPTIIPEPIPNPLLADKKIISQSPPTETETAQQKSKDAPIFDATLYNLEIETLSKGNRARITATMGETLGQFAEWLGVSVGQLRGLNHGRRSIRVHQKITIPVKSQENLEQFKNQRLEYHMAKEEDFYTNYKVTGTKERTVQYGDTLWSICKRDEEIPIWLLKKYNRQTDLESLKVKMVLTIPIVASIDEDSE